MHQDISIVLKAYERSLNKSDANAALNLYGEEPVFMAQNAPAFLGRDAVLGAYKFIFSILKLEVVFTIHEIVAIGDGLAYARTSSAGSQTLIAKGQMMTEANNELFVFRKESGDWKIHRYIFATSNPV